MTNEIVQDSVQVVGEDVQAGLAGGDIDAELDRAGDHRHHHSHARERYDVRGDRDRRKVEDGERDDGPRHEVQKAHGRHEAAAKSEQENLALPSTRGIRKLRTSV